MSVNTRDLKRNRLANVIGQETLNQVEHIAAAGAKLMMGGVLVPGDLMTDDPSSAPVLVRLGSVLRIEVASDTYLAFADDPADLDTVDDTTSPALKLASGTYLVVATGDFFKTSAQPARVEVIKGTDV